MNEEQNYNNYPDNNDYQDSSNQDSSNQNSSNQDSNNYQNSSSQNSSNYQNSSNQNSSNYQNSSNQNSSNYQNSSNQNSSNYQNYNNYQSGSSGKGDGPEKKNNFWKILLLVAVGAAAFGVVVGGAFYGINKVSNILAVDLKKSVETAENKEETKKEEKEADVEEKEEEPGILPGSGTVIDSTVVLSGSNSDITDLSGIVENVMPSIVAVTSTVPYTSSFFGQYYDEGETESSGSGVIYGDDGEYLYIVSNHHVIQNAKSVKITFVDETSADAVIKGSDSDVDLAVLAVSLKDLSEDTKKTVKQIAIGNSDDIQVGEMVVAIGNALGYGQSMTAGYVSAKDRKVTLSDTGVSMTLIQTDAAINPGNSGGALLNLRGELIGITNVKYATTDVEGMGFAIPISSATSIIGELQDIKELKDEEKGYLGISCEEISQEQNEIYNIPVGIYITEVAKNGAADKAGMMVGDIITKVNGTQVETRGSLQNRITSKKVGTTVKITFQRSELGKYVEHEVDVVLLGQESLDSISGASDDDQASGNKNDSGNRGGRDDSFRDDYSDFYNDFFNFYYNR